MKIQCFKVLQSAAPSSFVGEDNIVYNKKALLEGLFSYTICARMAHRQMLSNMRNGDIHIVF